MSVEKGMNIKTFEIKPCPFCGCQGNIYFTGEEGWFGVSCSNADCGCSLMPTGLFEKDDEVFERIERIVNEWNERALS